MTPRTRVLISGLSAGALLAAATVAGAQTAGRLVITPYAGVYAPTTSLAKFGATVGNQAASLTLKQSSALALGGNVSYWFTDRAALEVGAAYAFSDAKATAGVSGSSGFAFAGSENAYALMGSAKLMVSVLPTTSPMSLRLGVGPAVVTRGGSAYKADAAGKFRGLTDVGGALSLCTKIPITNLVAVRLRGEDYMYSAKLRFIDPGDPSNNFRFDSRFQNDLLFSAGLQFAFGR